MDEETETEIETETETETDSMKTRRNKLATQCQHFLALHLCSGTSDGVDVREEILANRFIF